MTPSTRKSCVSAGSSSADEAFPQARAALLSIILAMFTIILLTVLSSYERKGHYLSVSKTKAKLVKQKITNPIANVLAHIYAYVLFIIYMTPVVMIVLFAFQNYPAIRSKTLSMDQFTLINFFGQQDYEFLTNRGKLKTRTGAISGLFANADTVGGIRLSFVLSAIAARWRALSSSSRSTTSSKTRARSAALCWNTACSSRGCCQPS